MIKLSDKSNAFIKEVVENLPIGIILFDKNGLIHFVNRGVHEFGLLYPDLFGDSLLSKNIFSDDLAFSKSIIDKIKELKSGLPFEAEVSEFSVSGLANIKLIVKGTPQFLMQEFSGGTLLVEDLKVIFTTQKQIASRSDFIEQALNKVSDFTLGIDFSGTIKFVSGNASLLAFNRESILDFPLSNLFSEKEFTAIRELMKYSQDSKKIASTKITFEQADDKKIFSIKSVPVFSKTDEIQFIYLFFTEQLESDSSSEIYQKEINKLENYHTAISLSGEGIFILTTEGKITFCDSNAANLFGTDEKSAVGKFISSIVLSIDEATFAAIKQKLDNQNIVNQVLSFEDLQNQKKHFEFSFILNKNNQEDIVVLCKDVSGQVEAQTELQNSVNKFSQLVQNATQPICKIDHDGKFLFANSLFVETFLSELRSSNENTIYDLVSADQKFNLDNLEKAVPSTFELTLTGKNKEKLYYSVHIIPGLSGDEQYSYDCYFDEIGEKRLKEKEISLFTSVVEESNDGIILSCEGKIVLANKAFAKIFGFESSEELYNKTFLELVSRNDVLKVVEFFRQFESKKDSPSKFDFLAKRNDNSLFHTEFSAGRFEHDEKLYVVMTARDVTERIRNQQAIRDSEEKYRNITENIDDFLFTFEKISKNLRPVFCTSSIQKISGYTQIDFLADSRLMLKIIHPDDFQIFKPKLVNLLKSRIQNSGEFEFRIINKHGNIVWVRTKLNVIRIGAGRIQKIYGLVSDITFRKRAEEELKKSTQNLLKLNETKDRFISIISHDLRTPFSSILGFTDLLINDTELTEEEKRQYVLYIQESSHSMLSLVNSLLDWTRLQTGRIKFEPQKFNITEIVKESLASISGIAIQKDIEILNNCFVDRLVFADKSLLLQVFNNLISNAIKFTDLNGKIAISENLSSNPRFIEFSIKDTGIGIKEENIPLLFSIDAKFTSEGTAGEKGSGLGLSLVTEIIEKHGGRIWVESKYGEGSDFRFTLPVASAVILLVDDNKTDRLLYSKILKNITPDFEIDVASNGKEALEKIVSISPALVITDHDMPIMNGYEFVRELQKSDIKGKPPVIILSSDIDRNAINDYNEIGIEFVFHKPVNLTHFKQAVEKSLRKSFTNK